MLLVDVVDVEALLQFVQTPLAGNNQRGEIDFDNGQTFAVTLTPFSDVGRAVILQDITHLKSMAKIKSEFVFNRFARFTCSFVFFKTVIPRCWAWSAP